MAYINQTVEEILVLARHGVLEQISENRGLIEALGQDILGSLDEDVTSPFSIMSATRKQSVEESEK